VLSVRGSFSLNVGSAGCFWAVLSERGLILNYCGFERDYILIECGHENAMFSGRMIYVIGPLQLQASHSYGM
jgi:hypothetical protein